MTVAYALVGDPVAQSISPPMQRAALEATGIPGTYRAVRITAGELARHFGELREQFDGLNVTRPLKEEILPLLDEVSPAATAAGSVNTVTFRAGRAIGDSTDGEGFLRALGRASPGRRSPALILGAGGAARAVAAALAEDGVEEVWVFARNAAAAERLRAAGLAEPVADLPAALECAGVLINATPVGSNGDCPLPDGLAPGPGTAVVDLVYRPRATPLLRLGERAGCPTVEGVEMLVEQGALSFQIWTGRAAPLSRMRAAAQAALDGGSRPRSAS